MKTNCWLILGTMLATSALAQVNTNQLPAIPPPAIAPPVAPAPVPVMASVAKPATNAPAKKTGAAHKKGKKKNAAKAAAKAADKKDKAAKADKAEAAEKQSSAAALVPGPATVAGEHVNLRGQAGLQGEVVGHIEKGDTVTVLAEINLDKPKAGEPAHWAKIALPAGSKVWVDAKYVDLTNNVVSAKKLNMRGGPGENFSVLGVMEKGATIKAVTNKGDWTQIESPASAFAFVAAGFLKQEAPTPTNNPTVAVAPTPEATPVATPTPPVVTPPVVTPPVVPPTPTTVTEAQPIAPPAVVPPTPEPAVAATPPPTPEPTPTPALAPPPTPAPVATPAPAATPTPAPVTPTMTLPTPTLAPEDTNLPPPPPRIVTHEGTVRHAVSLVAPTYFELYDPANGKAIDYLYTTSTNLNLAKYSGSHVTATGEEALDPRWADTPVLTIQTINVLSRPESPKPAPAPVLKPIKKKF